MERVPASVVSTIRNVVISEETILRVNALNCFRCRNRTPPPLDCQRGHLE